MHFFETLNFDIFFWLIEGDRALSLLSPLLVFLLPRALSLSFTLENER